MRATRGWRKSKGRGLSIKGLETGERSADKGHIYVYTHSVSRHANTISLWNFICPTRESHVTIQI